LNPIFGCRVPAWAWTVLLLMSAPPATAQTPSSPDAVTLRSATDAAWQHQPEQRSLAARQQAAAAQRAVASGWTPEPPAVEASTRTDRIGSRNGARELTLGVSVPLWLPGERGRSQALADSQAHSLSSRAAAARWRIAGQVREAWWQWHLAQQDTVSAGARLAAAEQLATDAAKRVRAGDLARADQHQADGAVAAARADQALAQATLAAAAQALRSLTGHLPEGLPVDAEPMPEPTATPTQHPALLELQDRGATLQRARDVAAAQTRANPELSLGTVVERGGAGDATTRSVEIGLRWPLGGGAQHEAKVAHAAAELEDVRAVIDLAQTQISADVGAARSRVEQARAGLNAAELQARLASQTRGFIDKSFRLGQTDLPTRLRIEADAAQAERQAARARIELAAAVSAWRQALGLLP
jgi:outer membrane protein, heavy metal efflux system